MATTYTSLKCIESDDGTRRVDIEVRDDGRLFRFSEFTRLIEEYDGSAYWSPSHESGVYPDAASAEREARTTIPWLRNANSN